MAIPGLKVVAPSTPADVLGLMAAAIRDPDPVIFCEHKALFAIKGEVPDGEHVVPLGQAAVVREGADCTIVRSRRWSRGPPRPPSGSQAEHGISAEVIDLRTLVPLDVTTILASVEKTSRLFTVEENPRLCGWGAEIVSIVADEGFYSLDAPIGPDHDAAHPAAVGARRSRTRRSRPSSGSSRRSGRRLEAAR